jgi:hypothetical protein
LIAFDDPDSTLPHEKDGRDGGDVPAVRRIGLHKKLIVACVRLIEHGRVVRQKDRFGTTTGE